MIEDYGLEAIGGSLEEDDSLNDDTFGGGGGGADWTQESHDAMAQLHEQFLSELPDAGPPGGGGGFFGSDLNDASNFFSLEDGGGALEEPGLGGALEPEAPPPSASVPAAAKGSALRVSGLPSQMDAEQVKQLLSHFGPLSYFELGRGSAVLSYQDTSITAIAQSNLQGIPILGGSTLEVEFVDLGAVTAAAPPKPKPPAPAPAPASLGRLPPGAMDASALEARMAASAAPKPRAAAGAGARAAAGGRGGGGGADAHPGADAPGVAAAAAAGLLQQLASVPQAQQLAAFAQLLPHYQAQALSMPTPAQAAAQPQAPPPPPPSAQPPLPGAMPPMAGAQLPGAMPPMMPPQQPPMPPMPMGGRAPMPHGGGRGGPMPVQQPPRRVGQRMSGYELQMIIRHQARAPAPLPSALTPLPTPPAAPAAHPRIPLPPSIAQAMQLQMDDPVKDDFYHHFWIMKGGTSKAQPVAASRNTTDRKANAHDEKDRPGAPLPSLLPSPLARSHPAPRPSPRYSRSARPR